MQGEVEAQGEVAQGEIKAQSEFAPLD